MKTTIDTRFFRAGVGTVIYDHVGKVVIFERSQHPIGVWQFQQGGVDIEEDLETTLWRELKEEVGLIKSDFEYITEYPKWTIYAYNDSKEDSSKSRIGQAHKWYFLKLKSEVKIDLTKATEYEASNFKWVEFEAAIKITNDAKLTVYKELKEYFDNNILSNLN